MLSADGTHLERKYFPNSHLYSQSFIYSLINGCDLIVPQHTTLCATSD